MRVPAVRSICFLFALPVLFGSSAVALDLTVFAGGTKPGKLDIGGIETALDGGPVYGFRLGFPIVPMLGHEHTIAFSSDYLFPSGVSDITDAKGFVYNANLIFSLPVGTIVPYVTGGVGLIHQYGSPDLPVGTKFAVNYGGGLKFPRLVGPLGLRFDARGYTAVGTSGSSLNMLEVTAGVLLSIGR